MKKLYIISIILFLLPMIVLSATAVFDSDKTFSDSENRELATLPRPTFKSILSGEFRESFDTYYNDQFPYRESLLEVAGNFLSGFYPSFFVGEEDAAEVNGMLIYKGRVSEIFRRDDGNVTRFANAVNTLSLQCGSPETYVIIPTPAFSLYAPDDRLNEETDFSRALNTLENALSDGVIIDLTELFEKNKEDYLYFNTDHHWTGRGAYLAARELSVIEGEPLPSLKDYGTGRRSGFFGSLYKALKDDPVSGLLKGSEDTVEYFYPHAESTLTVYSTPTDAGESRELLYPEYDRDSNLYCIYMGGDIALGHIKTDKNNGKSIMIVRDSYGHAFIPFLTDVYEDIYFVEPRYFNGSDNKFDLGAYFKEKEIDTLLFLSYPNMALGVYWDTFSKYLEYME